MTKDFTASVRTPIGDRAGSDGAAAAAVAVVDLAGQLDGAAATQMEQAYDGASADAEAIVLDFGGITYINSTGIALVVGLLAKARADDVEVRVCGLSDHYRHIFEITRLADYLTFFDDESAALAAARTT